MSSETVLQRSDLPQPRRRRRRRASVRSSSRDRAPLHQLLTKDGLFTREEVSVALELIDGALAEPGGEYRVLVAELGDGALAGYICYGPTPMTEGTWDLYWIVTHPDARGGGVARALVARMEEELRGARRAPGARRDLAARRLRRGARVLRAARLSGVRACCPTSIGRATICS